MAKLRQMVGFLALVLATTAPLRGDDADPINVKLDLAKETHRAEIAKARKTVLDALDVKEDAARNDGNKKLVEQVQAAREAFEKDGALPKLVSWEAYQRGVKAANATMTAAYNEAIKEYLKAKQDAKAGSVEEELKAFQKSGGLAPAAPKEPIVLVTWAHEVKAKGVVVKRTTFKLYSNGHINAPDGPATWLIKGNLLIFTWPNPKAPGGAWKDVLTLAPDGGSYNGKNNEGSTISGVKIGGEEPAKKK